MGRKDRSQKDRAALTEGDEGPVDGNPEFVILGDDGEAYRLESLPSGEEQEERGSVTEKLGGEYSDEILDEVRQYSRPSWQQEDSSLDPIDDFDAYAEHGFKLPPGYYEVFEDAARKEVEALERMKLPPDPDKAALIEARKKLVKGRSLEELKWMKLHAYYRAMEMIRAERGREPNTEEREDYLARQGVPLHLVSAKEFDMKPEEVVQMMEQKQAEAAAKGTRASEGEGEKSSMLSLDSITESEVADWTPDWRVQSYFTHPECQWSLLQGLASAFASVSGKGGQTDSELGEETLEVEIPFVAQTTYTPNYLQQQKLRRFRRQQSAQRRLAFWLSLATVLGVSVYRSWRRRRAKGGPRGPQAGKAPSQTSGSGVLPRIR